jgi:hypothetical protein
VTVTRHRETLQVIQAPNVDKPPSHRRKHTVPVPDSGRRSPVGVTVSGLGNMAHV